MTTTTLPRPATLTPAARAQADLDNAWSIWSARAAQTIADGDPWARYVTVLAHRGDPYVITADCNRLRYALRRRARRGLPAPRAARRTIDERAQVTRWAADALRIAHRRLTQRPDDLFRAERESRFVDVLLAHTAPHPTQEAPESRSARLSALRAVLETRDPTLQQILTATSHR